MAALASTAKFHQNFWGEDNTGFDVLFQNFKAGITASKELGEFVRERIAAEEGYVKGLTKLQKSTSHIPTSTLGSFSPMWEVLKTMCEKLVTVHTQFVTMLGDLSREISDYHHVQKEKFKRQVKGEIEHTQETLNTYQSTEAVVQRSRKQYQQCVEHLAKLQGKVDKARAESASNPKLSGLETRVKQDQALLETAKTEYQAALTKHCDQVMEFQGKMSEACMKFESLDEEHLAQMVTFMHKISRTQDGMHVGVAELFTTLNSQLDVLSVEKLLKMFVGEKGTGTEKPVPPKFREIPAIVPSNATLSASMEDITAERRGSKTAKSKKRFKKKSKNASSSSSTSEQNQVQIPENAPEVDEEGYSIRPEDAANISKFPDEPPGKKDTSDSDSDFDDEPENKIKTLRIRESSTQPVASVDDIKASMMSLRLGTVSPGMRKATSSQSLNTTFTSRKDSIPDPLTVTAPSQSGVASLIDLSASESSSAPQNMPAPLIPLAPTSKGPGGNGGGANIPAPLLPSSSSTIRSGGSSQIPTPLIPSAVAMSSSGAAGGGGGLGGLKGSKVTTVSPMLSFDSKPLDVTASLPTWSAFPSPPNHKPVATPPAASATSSSNNNSSSNNSPSIARPRSGSLKTTQTPLIDPFATPTSSSFSSSSSSSAAALESSALSSIPAPPIPKKRSRSPGQLPQQQALTPTPQVTAMLQPIQDPPGGSSGGGGRGVSRSVDSSPVAGRRGSGGNSGVLSSSSGTSLDDDPTPPVPTPRGASLLHSPLTSPLPPTTNASPGPNNSNNPTTPPTITSTPPGAAVTAGFSATTPLSPLTISAHPPPPQPNAAATTTTTTSATSATVSPEKAVPLAVAIHETCNAIFRGSQLSECKVRVTGEVVMSFPASFPALLLGSQQQQQQQQQQQPLRFQLDTHDKCSNLLHNQKLLKRLEGHPGYEFNMETLSAHLKSMKEKASAPFYNVQILKYEVKVDGGTQLPLQLMSFMKCEPTTTNYRLDYVYQPSVFQSRPALCKVSFSVPIDGGMRNSLTKPVGVWSAENKLITWNIGDIPPSDNPTRNPIHAKFELSNGPSTPSPTSAAFTCEGDTLSGLSLDLKTPAYKVSLLKKKCFSGKYTAEPKIT